MHYNTFCALHVIIIIKYNNAWGYHAESFNWDSSNLHEQWKLFREQCQFLLIDWPDSTHTEPVHIAVVLNWMSPGSYKIFNNPTFPEDREKTLINVLEVLDGHFKPTQSVLHSWYQLGGAYSTER